MQDILNLIQTEARRELETYDGSVSGSQLIQYLQSATGMMYLPKIFT